MIRLLWSIVAIPLGVAVAADNAIYDWRRGRELRRKAERDAIEAERVRLCRDYGIDDHR